MISICIPTLVVDCDRTLNCLESIRWTLKDVAHEVVIIENHQPPQGFTDPVNAAIRASCGEYLVVTNDDVQFLEDWWPPLKQELDAGASVVFPTTIEGFMRYDFTGWCFAMTRKSMQRYSVDPPNHFYDPRFKIWWQDTDLLFRLRQDGNPPVRVLDSHIKHGLSKTLEHPDQIAWIRKQILEDQKQMMIKWGRIA